MNRISLLFASAAILLSSITQAELLTPDQMLETVNKRIVNIDTDELVEILDTTPNAILIDVRTKPEIDRLGTILRGQNIHIARGWLEFRIGDIAEDKDTPIIVYCGRNLRSPLAAKTLENMGYTNVKNYESGYFDWKDAGNPVRMSDYEPDSILYRKPEQVMENVYSAIGATQPPSYENANHNNNLSFVVTTDGVLVFNAGGNYLLAKAMHDEIKKITDQPVKYVVYENAQSHAILGGNYWREQGATIISHVLADKEIQHHGEDIYDRAARRLKDKIIGSKIVRPDLTFEEKMSLPMGDTQIDLLYIGSTHSPDDIQLWLPEQKLLISGDAAFNERMLPVFPHTDTGAWIQAWDKIEALEPKIIIPGHGGPTDLATTTKFTKDYLVFLRAEIEKILDDDGGLLEAYEIDQSAYRDWGTYKELHKQNAERVFKAMEFE